METNTTSVARPISAADIVIAPATVSRPKRTAQEEVINNEFFRALRALRSECSRDKNVKAIMCITACIEHGIDTGPRIIAALTHIGLNKQSVGAQLDKNRGADSSRFRWWRDEDRRYRLHRPSDDEAATPPPVVT